MSQSLQQRIDSITRRARQLSLVHGLCWFLAVGVSAAFVFGWIDYFLRLDDRGVRGIISAIVAAIVLWSFRRLMWPVVKRRFTHLEVALQVERQFPQLAGRLSSALEFLRTCRDQPPDSDKLRQSVVSETEVLAGALDFRECLDSQASRRAAIVCIAVVILLAVICGLDTESTTLAARRLVLPWSTESWPRWNSLEVVDTPPRIALGQDIAITVRDRRRRIPKTVTLQVWYDGDTEDEAEVITMQRNGKRFRHQRRNVTRGFQYRAEGGDDDAMEWQRLELVEPVQLTTLDVTVEPPQYAAMSTSQLPAGAIQVLEGSSVSVQGEVNRRVEKINVHLATGDEESVAEAVVATDGLSFAIPADRVSTDEPVVAQYWIEMIEADGVVSVTDARWSWKVIADQRPVVTVTTPAVESYFMASASVPLRVVATDDLAIRSLRLTSGTKTIPLSIGTDSAPQRTNLASGADVRDVTRALDLSEFELQPNDSIELTFIAEDYKQQASEPVTRTTTVISRDDFDYRSQDKQKRLLAKLFEALRLQNATRSQVASLETQVRAAGALSAGDTNRLRASDVQQQQVARMLGEQAGGAAQLVDELISDIESNKAVDSEVSVRMNRLASTLANVNRELMPSLQSDLLRATKLAHGVDESLLGAIGATQEAITAELQLMIDQLSQWDDFRRFARGVNELLKQQQALADRVRQLPTLGRSTDELTDQQRADLARAAGEQSDLAKRVDRLKFEMRRLGETVGESDPAAAEALSTAIEQSQSSGLSETMRSASNEISKNQLGNASRSQSDAEAGLERVLDALTDSNGRSEQANDVEVKQIAAALAELKSRLTQVASQQQALIQETTEFIGLAEPGEQLERLAGDQQRLGGEVHAIREELKLPKAFEFGVSSVHSNMEEAASTLMRQTVVDTVLSSQQRAMNRMKQLLDALDSQAKQSGSTSAAISPASNGDSTVGGADGESGGLSAEELRLLHHIQIELLDRTTQLEQDRPGGDELTEQQRSSLERLAKEQGELAALILEAISSGMSKPTNNEMDDLIEGDPTESEDNLNRLLEESGIPSFWAK